MKKFVRWRNRTPAEVSVVFGHKTWSEFHREYLFIEQGELMIKLW